MRSTAAALAVLPAGRHQPSRWPGAWSVLAVQGVAQFGFRLGQPFEKDGVAPLEVGVLGFEGG